MVICIVVMVVKRGWTENRFFIFTLNMNHKIGKSEHKVKRKKSWNTCSLQKLDFLSVYFSLWFLNSLASITSKFYMRTNLSCTAFSSFGHSGRKGADIYLYVRKQPQKTCAGKRGGIRICDDSSFPRVYTAGLEWNPHNPWKDINLYIILYTPMTSVGHTPAESSRSE